MAADPQFAATPLIGAATIGNAETSLSVPLQSVAFVTATVTAVKIEEIVVTAVAASLVPATSQGLVYIFVYDGSNYFLYDTLTVTPVTASTTVAPFRTNRTYTNLWVPGPTSWALRASQSVAANASLLRIEAFGGSY